jgi:hypothetical protein
MTTTIAFRIEILDDVDGARTGVKQEIWSFSLPRHEHHPALPAQG